MKMPRKLALPRASNIITRKHYNTGKRRNEMKRSDKLKEKIAGIAIAQGIGFEQFIDVAVGIAANEAVGQISDFINPYSSIERPFLSAALIYIGEEMQKGMDEVEKKATKEIIEGIRKNGTAEEEWCNPCKE